MRRVIRYQMPKEAEERASERKKLESVLAEGIRTILNGIDAPTPGEPIQPLSVAEQAQQAIEAEHPKQAGLVRQYMDRLAEEITTFTPSFAENESDRWDEQLLEALGASTDLVSKHTRLAASIALMGAADAARAMYKGFARILNLYTYQSGFSGQYHAFDQDLARFLGHELFVSFCACLIQEERWELLANLLDETLYARDRNFGLMEAVPFTELSEPIRLLTHRKQRLKSNHISLHADLLHDRHTQGDLGQAMPLERFMEADYFLFLRGQLKPAEASRLIVWLPWSTLSLRQPPHYLVEATSATYAQQLLRPLAVPDISTFRKRYAERASKLVGLWQESGGFWFDPLRNFDPERIGSR